MHSNPRSPMRPPMRTSNRPLENRRGASGLRSNVPSERSVRCPLSSIRRSVDPKFCSQLSSRKVCSSLVPSPLLVASKASHCTSFSSSRPQTLVRPYSSSGAWLRGTSPDRSGYSRSSTSISTHSRPWTTAGRRATIELTSVNFGAEPSRVCSYSAHRTCSPSSGTMNHHASSRRSMENGCPVLGETVISGRRSGNGRVAVCLLSTLIVVPLLVLLMPNSLRIRSRPWDSRRLTVPGGQRWRAAISAMLIPSR